MMTISRILRVASAIVAFGLVAASPNAAAQTFSNSFSGNICCFGSPDTTTYGQVFNTSGGTLTDWSFFASSGTAGNLQFEIASWDGSNAIGPALYASSSFAYAGGAQTLSFSGINTGLSSGSYIAFITVAGQSSPATEMAIAGSDSDGGLGGGFTFLNSNGSDPLAFHEGSWYSVGQWGPSNMQFSATFASPVPEPETYAMLLAGLGLLGFAARRRKQKESAAA